jgi:predicted Zn-dependent protease with MMP-like domain
LITSSIASTLIGAYAGIEIDEEVLDGVGELPPRIQRQMLTSSVARAKWLGCNRVSVEHLAEVLSRSRLGKHKGNGLGFQMAR